MRTDTIPYHTDHKNDRVIKHFGQEPGDQLSGGVGEVALRQLKVIKQDIDIVK